MDADCLSSSAILGEEEPGAKISPRDDAHQNVVRAHAHSGILSRIKDQGLGLENCSIVATT